MPLFHIALLRGINVGKAKRVAMADLRKLVEGLGYGNVATLLNSGNIVFTMPKPSTGNAGAKIAKAITDELGVDCRVTVISAVELAAIIESNPFLDRIDNPSRMMVGVLADAADGKKLGELHKQKWGPEALAIRGRAIHYWCPKGILESPLADAVGRTLKDAVTTRNWSTMLKLRDMTAG